MLAPALEEIGERWERGAATVAQEHLATAVVASIMATLAPGLDAGPAVQQRIVLACTEGELHELGLRMLGDFLEGDGWEVLYLGAVTPAIEIGAYVAEVDPVAVGLSVTLTTHLELARTTISAVRERSGAYIMVGGGAFGGDAIIARDIGADGFAPDAGAASTLLRDRFGEQAG
jgi:methanogenic corrinoid protein MtbC1